MGQWGEFPLSWERGWWMQSGGTSASKAIQDRVHGSAEPAEVAHERGGTTELIGKRMRRRPIELGETEGTAIRTGSGSVGDMRPGKWNVIRFGMAVEQKLILSVEKK